MTEEAAESARNGTYQEWDSYNEHLQIQEITVYNSFPGALLTFQGHYNILATINPYQELNGIESAEIRHALHTGFIGADICLAVRSNLQHFYINAELESFDHGSPCYEFNSFEVSPEQVVTNHGAWNSCSNKQPPNALIGAEDCQAFLSIRPTPNPS